MVSTTSVISEKLILIAGPQNYVLWPRKWAICNVHFFRKKLLKKRPLGHSAVTSSCLTVPLTQDTATFYITELPTE